MEKSVLQRLFGFLWDLSDQRKTDPPSGDDPGDKRRPRLTAIEGGKGKEDRGGNERTKPCAVIGIPYSSDAAEETVEKKEESIMKCIAKYMFVFAAAAAAVFALSACGGGGGGMSGTTTSAGTTGFTSGVITGFGTLHLGTGQNEKVFDTRNAVLKRVDDNVVNHNVNHNVNEDNVVFRKGMHVEIFHNADDNNAVEVRFKNDLEGSITAIVGTPPTLPLTLTVFGVSVLVDSNTTFDNDFGDITVTLATLAVGNVVEVSGQFDNNGVLHATFIEGKHASSAGRTFEMKGMVAGLGGTAPNQTFTVNGVSFADNSATVLKDLPSGLSNGLFVEVKTQSTTSPFLVTRIEGPAGDFENPENEIRNAAKASVEGFVTGLTGTTPNFSFTLSGTSVTTSSATTVGLGLVSPGAHIEAEGPVVGGVINATKIFTRP
jgi:hypothetical protein